MRLTVKWALVLLSLLFQALCILAHPMLHMKTAYMCTSQTYHFRSSISSVLASCNDLKSQVTNDGSG